MDQETFRFIQDNAPNASEEMIHEAYTKYEQNVLEVIAFLLDIPPPEKKTLTEWDNRREIFDAYDKEMQKLMAEMKKVQAPHASAPAPDPGRSPIQVNPRFAQK